MHTAIVTGANRGIGLEVARQLAALGGIRVILTSRDPEKGNRALEAIRASIGSDRAQDCAFHPLDVTDGKSILALREYVETSFGGLDILVNNAAVNLDFGRRFQDVSGEIFQETMRANLHGPLALCQAFLPGMIRRGYGRIVNVSSDSGQRENLVDDMPAYRLSKWSLNGLTLLLADSLKGGNVLVNAVHPGWVRTEMGGPNAPRLVDQGAETIVWLATLPDGGPHGKLFFDKREIAW
jgi:NAD(P)-dependent dehydrogenase (short-subunit alcohol dehydrogenase family)